MITVITNSTLLKWIFGYSFTLSSLAFIEQEFTQTDFFLQIQNAIPSKIAMILGIVYGIVILLGRVSKEWKQHVLNIQEIKKGKEEVEQETIITDRMKIDVNSVPVKYEEIEYPNNKIEDE
ncbi:protein of unknown function [Tenacibaculum sp. 190524A02b]|uniref:hypothetical protein n=1 Tax=Tenacibaculum vairaonense TaxID=3137860 RepID=UPI0032B17A75